MADSTGPLASTSQLPTSTLPTLLNTPARSIHSSDSATIVGNSKHASMMKDKDAAANSDAFNQAGFAESQQTPLGGLSEKTPAAEVSPLPITVDASGQPVVWDWEKDPENPYNWSMSRKWQQVICFSSIALTTSIGTSIMSPAHTDLMIAFGANSTAAIAPLTCYVMALGIGPVIIGGPLSEIVGRYPILLVGTPFGMLFTLGCALVPESSLAGLCILRFLAGFALAPSLAIASGVLTETFRPVERGLPVACFIVTPFLGPGMGPVLGAFASRKGWRWTQWTFLFFLVASYLLIVTLGRETFHPVVKRRRAKQLGITLPAEDMPPQIPFLHRIHGFLTVGLIRPLHMMVAEPIVGLSSLYVACEFATLFSFFAAVPFVFQLVYGFDREQAGLVFSSIIVGALLGLVTVMLTDVFIYRKMVPRFHPAPPPPEHRLYAAMIGSVGLPVGLFWFGWSGYHHDKWVSPALAIVPFAWGNICIFISLLQYIGDTYTGAIVASAASANSLARYCLAGAFPLFTLQMYEKLGINWASSLLGFISVALLPVPWLFFKFGETIRKHSKYVQ